ncbi:ABC transporter substrate-binding protein [Janthinobacterium sp. 17J80-10]|uniref:ABC transporter substrate-binding protein n=1 Tax=Janthinobacterium sp. 17J80-10 TaxID=2497863 RepID=UPI0010056F72|nr:ABC transporter substrate-binding protein [Janthinobacterium sp. 17J80-10]QAU35712.1 ABC transporter substrate-binding protein [Janthinobacterium sp. 17J80-10]
MKHRISRAIQVMALAVTAVVSHAAIAASADAVSKSKQEKGLLIYGNISAENFAPAVAAFQKKYPWIKVETLDLGPAPTFERYYSESSVGKRSADILAVASPGGWLRMQEKQGIEAYVAEGSKELPEWSRPFPGLYTISTDPLVFVYNKLILPANKRPKSLAQLAVLAKQHPQDFANRISTYDAARHPFAYAAHWAYANRTGAAGWNLINQLGPITRPEGGGAAMVEKVVTGEYSLIYFGSPLPFVKRLQDGRSDRILGWNLIEDGTPVMMRGVAITKKAESKYSAQLFLDFVVSHAGQVAVGVGGLTPYRSDIKKGEVPFLTYDMIREKIGERNMIMVDYNQKMVDDTKQFTDAWVAAYKPVKP